MSKKQFKTDKKGKSKRIYFGNKVSLPIFETVVVFVLLLIGAFFWGNRLPIVQLNNLSSVFHKSSQNPGKLDTASLNQLYAQLRNNFDGNLDINKLNVGIKKGLVNAAGDPHTEYFTAKEAKEFMNDLDGKLSGVGIEISKKNGNIVVISPVDGTPAAKAGIRSNDIIAKVNGKDATSWSVDTAAHKIRGKANTKVKITVIRNGKAKTFNVTRANITVPSVKYSITPDNIGYLQISRFGDDTVDLANQAAQDFKSHHVKGVILDLRNDGGGLLNSAVGVSSLWLNNKVVVSEKTGGVTQDTLHSENDAPLHGIPTIVLVNGGSASASEITAGALHDNKAAKLVGEKTFGKGSVQSTINLKDGGLLKVTVAHWYTPDGINIDKEGIKPDIKVKLTDADYNASKDPQKATAIKLLNKK